MSNIELEDLIELSEHIENEELRKRTQELLEDFHLSNDNFKQGRSRLEKIPCWIGGHHYYEGGLVDHIYSVTELCIKMVENFEDVYDKELDRDSLVSAALLHDLTKQFILDNMEGFKEYSLDHNVWMSCELYSRGFPEKVIEIVADHGGETNEPTPRSDEARILHHADSLDAEMNQSNALSGVEIFGL